MQTSLFVIGQNELKRPMAPSFYRSFYCYQHCYQHCYRRYLRYRHPRLFGAVAAFVLLIVMLMCSANSRADQALVAVASNFNAPMQRLVAEFEAQSSHRITLTFGSSGKIYAQILNGAPYDAFFSADQDRPQRLESAGLTVATSRFTYATGRLALWASNSNAQVNNAEIIRAGNYNKLALANPTLAPYGQAAQQTLTHLGLAQTSQPHWVLGENIGQVYQFVKTNNADAGFVALSQIMMAGQIKDGTAWVVPSHYHQPILQDAVVLTRGSNNPAVLAFMAYVKTAQAQAILNDFGYLTANTQSAPAASVNNTSTIKDDIAAIWLTLKLAATVTIILLFISTPIAWWLARSRSCLRGPVSALVTLPLMLPPTVLGFYLLIAMGPSGPIGQLTQELGIGLLPFTFWGLVIASVFYSLPFVVQPIQNAIVSMGDAPLEAAATLRASPWDTFCNVVLPQAKPGFFTAAILGFAHTIGEFGVILMIGGNIPEETRVVSVQIYDHVEALNYGHAHALSAIMIAFAFSVLLALNILNNKKANARLNIGI